MPTQNLSPVSIEKLIRQKIACEGTLSPDQFPALLDFLAAPGGEIHYRLTAHQRVDITGDQTRHVECIISGWFFVLDSQTLEAKRFRLDLISRLVLVEREDDLPALDQESDEEDYIVCGPDLDVVARVQEEILLALPADTPSAKVARSDLDVVVRRSAAQRNLTQDGSADGDSIRPSAFAKLAALKRR